MHGKHAKFGIVDSNLFNKSFRNAPLEVFVCGPGSTHESYKIRNSIKEFLELDSKIKVRFGEDLEQANIRKAITKNKSDLQTLELAYSHMADFTVLLLESPGAIAELGSFSMLESLRPRLYVVLSEAYYKSESYIARGPLSLLSMDSINNIIYYQKDTVNTITSRLNLPKALHKYGRGRDGFRYTYNSKYPPNRGEYANYIKNVKSDFYRILVLLAITILEYPTFSELVLWLELSPNVVKDSLSRMYNEEKIEKRSDGSYRSKNGLKDGLLNCFDTGLISQRRAQIIATRGSILSLPV